MKVKFLVDWSVLRGYCVKYNFYTCGTSEEYSDIFNIFNTISAANNFDEMQRILRIVATDILEHSEQENYILYADFKEKLKEVMTGLLDIGAVSIYFD